MHPITSLDEWSVTYNAKKGILLSWVDRQFDNLIFCRLERHNWKKLIPGEDCYVMVDGKKYFVKCGEYCSGCHKFRNGTVIVSEEGKILVHIKGKGFINPKKELQNRFIQES
jgi:hypothetical protein